MLTFFQEFCFRKAFYYYYYFLFPLMLILLQFHCRLLLNHNPSTIYRPAKQKPHLVVKQQDGYPSLIHGTKMVA